MDTIVMTACKRPEYTQHVVDSLSQCWGISDYKFIPFAEGVDNEVVKILKSVKFCETEVHVNKRRLGHTLNTHAALSRGFESSDYVILIEDDTVLAKDFLNFHRFCKEKFKDDKSIYTVSAGHYSEPLKKHDRLHINLYKRNEWFTNQGWGTWIDRWEEDDGIKNNWELPETVTDTSYMVNYRYGGWDGLMNKVTRRGREEIVPIISRVKNIGAKDGVHTGHSAKYPSFEQYHKEEIEVRDWAGLHKLDGLLYQEKTTSFSDYLLR